MFMQNKSLPEIIVSLDIDVKTVQAYYCDYLRLMNMKNLVDIYNEIGPDLPLFLHLYRQIKKEVLNKQEIVELIRNQRKFIDMEKAINLLNNHINYLRREKEERILDLEKEVEHYKNLATQLGKDIFRLEGRNTELNEKLNSMFPKKDDKYGV